MQIKSTAAAIAVSLAIISGCEADSNTGGNQAPALPQAGKAVPADDMILVTVNDTAITKDMFAFYFQQRMKGQGDAHNTPAAQSQALNELINMVLLSQAAEKQALGDNPEVKMALEMQRMKLLSSMALNQYAKDNEPDEAALKKLYDEQSADGGSDTEYQARHILVKTEEEAKDLIAQLDGGADFAELAKEHSTGPTGKNGGDLGWFGAGQMVKPFSDAVAAMEKSAHSQTPVKTQFGWHVIKLEDSRSKEPPAFEDVKEKLRSQEQRRLLAEYVKQVSEQATIKVNEKLTKKSEGAAAE